MDLTPEEKAFELYGKMNQNVDHIRILINEIRDEWCRHWEELPTECDYWNEVEETIAMLDFQKLDDIERGLTDLSNGNTHSDEDVRDSISNKIRNYNNNEDTES